MIYGYARVSTAIQKRDGNSLEEQTASLEKYGCQEIITEAFSGKTMERPQFKSLLRSLKAVTPWWYASLIGSQGQQLKVFRLSENCLKEV